MREIRPHINIVSLVKMASLYLTTPHPKHITLTGKKGKQKVLVRISDKINISAGHKDKNKNGEQAEVVDLLSF